MHLIPSSLVIVGLLTFGPHGFGAQATCTDVGSERWTVKTMAPLAGGAHRFDAVQFVALPTPSDIQVRHDKMLDSRYPTPIKAGLHEGSLVRVRGWVQRIKVSPDDRDYHIEITPEENSTDGMVIVEVPAADAAHVADTDVRQLVGDVRTWLYAAVNLTHEPSSNGSKIGGRAYTEFSGALFFDGPHAPNCDARGSKPGAATCWECIR
jgi:hypothetical protein